MSIVKYKVGNNWASVTSSGSIATDSTYGYVKIATDADVEAGTDNGSAITSKQLKNYSDNHFVHLTGDETIAGTKSFLATPLSLNGHYHARSENSAWDDVTRDNIEYNQYQFSDKNGTNISFLEESWNTDGSRYFQLVVRNSDNTGWEHPLRIHTPNSTTGGVSTVTTNLQWTFSDTIQGTAYRALWGDLAEYYLTDTQYPKGTLVQFGGDKEITIAKNKVNAVITSEPGFILNSEQKDSQAIALIGRVPVRVIGKVKKFDKIALSYIDGVGCVNNDTENPIGIALESKDDSDEGLVLCSVKIDLV